MTFEQLNELIASIHSKKLYRLCLNDDDLTTGDRWSIIQAIMVSNEIQELEFVNYVWPPAFFSQLLNAFKRSKHLKVVIISADLSLPPYASILNEFLSENNSVTSLDLSNSNLGNEGIYIISKSFAINRSLLKINLSHSRMTAESCDDLAMSLMNNPSITELNLDGNTLHGNEIKSIAALMRENLRIKKLSLRNNALTADDIAILNTMLKGKSRPINLSIRYNNLGDEGVVAFAHFIQHAGLDSMDISTNKVTAVGLTNLVNQIKNSSSLLSFYCRENKVDDAGGVALAELLLSVKSLKILDAYCCNIGMDGMSAIASAYNKKSDLVFLNLGGANFNFNSASELACGLRKNLHLRTLNLANCKLDDLSGQQIVAALINHLNIATLDLSENGLDKGSANAIGDLLIATRTLTYLNLNKCYSNNDDAVAIIFNDLQYSKALTNLHFNDNKINDQNAKILSDTLCVNQNLEYLSICNSNMAKIGLSYIMAALPINYSLLQLEVGAVQASQYFINQFHTSLNAQLELNGQIDRWLSCYLADMFQVAHQVKVWAKRKWEVGISSALYAYDTVHSSLKDQAFVRCLQQTLYYKTIPQTKMDALVNSSIYKDSGYFHLYQTAKNDQAKKSDIAGWRLYKLGFFPPPNEGKVDKECTLKLSLYFS